MTANRWIALFRGVNVGGNNKLPMAELRGMATDLGFISVATYIQSGNLVLTAPMAMPAEVIEATLADAIAKRFGFRPIILMRSSADFVAALDRNPFTDRVTEGKQLHLFFYDGSPDKWDDETIRALTVDGEDVALTPGLVYLYARDGIGRSKLAEKLPRFLPARHSARNLNSVQAILALAGVP
jgi:uncharacterized protein (DUF1697 family)